MSLKDVEIKIEYRTMLDNMAHDFYIPLLNEAVCYKRAVGFFSSSVLTEISKGLTGLINNGGRIKLIASPNLTDADIDAIRFGYEQRDSVIKRAIIRELSEPITKYQEKRLNYLANLIADGYLDIKIAVTESSIKTGMYHEKVGIVKDNEGNTIAFSGSMNESANALLANYETVDVFKSWTGDADRVAIKERAFDAIWDNAEANVRVINIDELNDEIIKRYRTTQIDYAQIDRDEKLEGEHDNSFFNMPYDLKLYDYQKEAITNWMEHSCCGIFDMATGTGKTFTGLAAVCTLSKSLNGCLGVVIVAPYRHLVEQWVEDINSFGVNPIIAYSYPGQKWREEFSDAINAYNCGAIKSFCIITTNATFSGNDFQEILARFRKNYCFVVDEAHNFGAKKLASLLPRKARYRLALSATLERHWDSQGTEALRHYFGPTCIEFGLNEAIKRGFLTPYYYHPVVVYLNDEELNEYKELTALIVKVAGIDAILSNGENSYLDRLLIKRARIVAGCREKIDSLLKVMSEYKDEHNMLIYCGATKYDIGKIDDKQEIRQIDEVNRNLYERYGMNVRKFTSSEDIAERKEIKEMFVNQEIQVITAIKCLDEGVNIPAIEKAFILASSTNPKEYIQRRGRVLRKYEGKDFAVIYDFITLPRRLNEVKYLTKEERRYDLSLVKREFARMIDFSNSARNPSEIDELKRQIEEAYYISDFTDEGGIYNE